MLVTNLSGLSNQVKTLSLNRAQPVLVCSTVPSLRCHCCLSDMWHWVSAPPVCYPGETAVRLDLDIFQVEFALLIHTALK